MWATVLCYIRSYPIDQIIYFTNPKTRGAWTQSINYIVDRKSINLPEFGN